MVMKNVKILKDFVNPTTLIPKKAYLTINEYEYLQNPKSRYPDPYYHLKFFIIKNLPLKHFPSNFEGEAIYLKQLYEALNLLNQVYLYPGERIPIKLYDIVIKYGKIPNRALDLNTKDIISLVEDYESFNFLYRYFQNHGKVFFSESMKLIYEHNFKHVTPMLEMKNIIRKGNFSDTEAVLNFKTKSELLEVFKNQVFNSLNIERISKLQKSSIIKEMILNEEVVNLNLPFYFYFLSDNYQKFKEWIEYEEIFFKVFCMLNQDITHSFICMSSIMKDLIRLNEFEIAIEIGKIYNDFKKYFRQNPNFREDFEDQMIEIQNKKCKKLISKNC
jgi:hypothetical protein